MTPLFVQISKTRTPPPRLILGGARGLNYVYIVNRPKNGCETVAKIKAVSIDSFKQIEVAKKVDYVTN